MPQTVEQMLNSLHAIGGVSTDAEVEARQALLTKWSPRLSDPKTVEQWNTVDALVDSETGLIPATLVNVVIAPDGNWRWVPRDVAVGMGHTEVSQAEIGAHYDQECWAFAKQDGGGAQYLATAQIAKPVTGTINWFAPVPDVS